MKLFHWSNVKALERYSNGDVIVAATTVEEARDKAMNAAGPCYFNQRGFEGCYFANLDGDDADDWRTFRDKLICDLNATPTIVESSVVMILGSE